MPRRAAWSWRDYERQFGQASPVVPPEAERLGEPEPPATSVPAAVPVAARKAGVNVALTPYLASLHQAHKERLRRLYAPRPVPVAEPEPPEAEPEPAPEPLPVELCGPPPPVSRWKRILIEVALDHGFTVADLRGRRRCNTLVAARREAMCRLYLETQATLPQIGCWIGKDHTTVLHGLRKAGVYGSRAEPPAPIPFSATPNPRIAAR